MRTIYHIGRYFGLMQQVFKTPEKYRIYLRMMINEMDSIGIQSVGIISLISFFMGAVVAMQTAFNITDAWTPLYLVSFTVRQSVILEFSSTVMCLILAGKVGSRIASEIGSMRVSEQIDALDIMGVNSPGYLIMPKISAAILIMPFLVLVSMFVAIIGGYIASVPLGGLVQMDEFEYGMKLDFRAFDIYYSLIKSIFFAFAITSIPAYHGYHAYGGALAIGKASLKGVVYSMIAVLVLNYVITQFLLL